MKELADILSAYFPGTDAALATVVNVQGSAYRRPGARMLINADGSTVGGVSGGCLERDVIQRAGAVISSVKAVSVRYDTALDPDGGTGYSLGCGGTIDILIESLNTSNGAELMVRLAATQLQRAVVATVISRHHSHLSLGQRMWIDQAGKRTGDFENAEIELVAREIVRSRNQTFEIFGQDVEVFFEVHEPPLELVIFGAGNDAVPLVRMAGALGWKVKVVDVGSTPLNLNRDLKNGTIIRCNIDQVARQIAIREASAVVVMTHNFKHDSQLIRWLAGQSVRYVGLLGPRHRSEEILRGVHVAGLHFPVGLDLGAENPEEVALAIVAEITAVLHGRRGGHLSLSDGPIHAGNPSKNLSMVGGIECPVAAS